MPKNEIKEQFEEKYNLYGDMLYKIAYLYLGNQADAEDALQEVFIKLLSRTLPFKNAEHEKAWLIRVTQNKCRDMLRSAHGVSFPENESVAAEGDDDSFAHDDYLSFDFLKTLFSQKRLTKAADPPFYI